jgi:hypothetical protein
MIHRKYYCAAKIMDEGLIRTGFKAVWEKSRPSHLVFPLKNPPRATRHSGRKTLNATVLAGYFRLKAGSH